MPSINKCPVCGRLFEVFGDKWGYDYDGTRVCSYHCMRDMRKKDLGRETMKGIPMKAEQLTAMFGYWKEKRSKDEIASLVGTSRTTVGRYVALFNKGYVPGEHVLGNMKKAPEPEQLPEPVEAPEPEAPRITLPGISIPEITALDGSVDRARIISVLCDIAEQLIVILREDVA